MTVAVHARPSLTAVPTVRPSSVGRPNGSATIALAVLGLLALAVMQGGVAGACSGTALTAEAVELPTLSASA